MAIINLVDKISSNIDNNKYTIGIFLDLSKAFDTIDHQILLRKLQIEYRVSNQIQVSIHIIGIRYRTSSIQTQFSIICNHRSIGGDICCSIRYFWVMRDSVFV